jgi:hypothetical protein
MVMHGEAVPSNVVDVFDVYVAHNETRVNADMSSRVPA